MPIDTSIPLRAYEGQFNPAAALQQGLQLRDMMQRGEFQQQQAAMQRQEFDMRQRGMAQAETRQARLADLLPGAVKGDRAAIDELAGIDPEMFMKLDDRQKAEAKQRADTFAAVGAQIRTLPYAQRRAAIQQIGPQLGFPEDQIASFDPTDAALDTFVAQSLGIKGVLDRQAEAFTRDLDLQKFAYQQRNDATNRAVTIQGQIRQDRRAREANAGGGKPPAGYRYSADGLSLEPIPGGPAGGGKLTEDQGKATGNYRVMREALGTLNTVKGYSPTLLANALDAGDLTGTKLSQTDRRALNAQRAFVVAALRAESGATYGPSEVIDKIRTLFPVPGDEKDVLADKARLRQEFAMAAKVRAGTGVSDYVPSDKRPKTRPVAGGTLTPAVNGVRTWKPR